MSISELGERLRRANPEGGARAGASAVPDERLLAKIVAERTPSGVHALAGRGRIALLIAAAAVVVVGTAAAAAKLAVEYFDAGDREPTPSAVVTQLRRLAARAPDGFGSVDAGRYLRLAAFDTEQGRVTLYIAPFRHGDGYCVTSATGHSLDGGGCGPGRVSQLEITHGGFWASAYGDVFPLYGRLAPGASRIELRFEDGSLRPAARRGPWWVYVVSGRETDPGQRPQQLIARAPDGDVVARQALESVSFTGRAVAQAAIPSDDGSLGQRAMRRSLEGMLSRGAGGVASEVELAHTHLLRRFQTPEGPFFVYSAPLPPDGICVAYAGSALAGEATGGCWRKRLGDRGPRSFTAAPPAIIQLARNVVGLEGPTPPHTERIELRFQDGSQEPVALLYPGSFATWLGPERLAAGQRPIALVALDRDGGVLETVSLPSDRFAPCERAACR
jgi:hypothetical protein